MATKKKSDKIVEVNTPDIYVVFVEGKLKQPIAFASQKEAKAYVNYTLGDLGPVIYTRL